MKKLFVGLVSLSVLLLIPTVSAASQPGVGHTAGAADQPVGRGHHGPPGGWYPCWQSVTRQIGGGVLAECEQRDPGSLSWCKVGVSGTVEFCYGASCGAAEPQFTFAELFSAGEGGAAVTGPTHRRVKGERSR